MTAADLLVWACSGGFCRWVGVMALLYLPVAAAIVLAETVVATVLAHLLQLRRGE